MIEVTNDSEQFNLNCRFTTEWSLKQCCLANDVMKVSLLLFKKTRKSHLRKRKNKLALNLRSFEFYNPINITSEAFKADELPEKLKFHFDCETDDSVMQAWLLDSKWKNSLLLKLSTASMRREPAKAAAVTSTSINSVFYFSRSRSQSKSWN